MPYDSAQYAKFPANFTAVQNEQDWEILARYRKDLCDLEDGESRFL